MKRISFFVSASAFVITGALVAFSAFAAFVNTFYWADRFKDSAQIPDSVQALLTVASWVFWGGIVVLAVQVAGLVALFKFKRMCSSESVTPNNSLVPTPGTTRHVS